MKTFVDTAGRTWTISGNHTSFKRVRDTLGVDLVEVEDGKVFAVLSDPYVLGNVLYVLCQPQAEKLGVTDEDFGSALGGDSMEAATQALVSEITDFFPSARRKILQELITRLTAVQQGQMDLLMKKIESGEIERRLKESAPEESGS